MCVIENEKAYMCVCVCVTTSVVSVCEKIVSLSDLLHNFTEKRRKRKLPVAGKTPGKR